MKAIVRYGFGKGELALRDVPKPEVGRRDVLLQVKSAGLCGSDLHAYDGESKAAPIGSVVGHEFAGEIAEAGTDVTAWKPGDRVFCDNTYSVCGTCLNCMRGDQQNCRFRKGMGYGADGGFAEYVLIPGGVLDVYPNVLLRVPEGIPFDVAAILDPAANGYKAVIQQGRLTPGEHVAVTGIGPLGLNCIANAKAGGAAQIIAIIRKSTAKLHRDLAKHYGATMVLEQDGDDIRGIVSELTQGEGLELVVDTAGHNSLFPLLMDIAANSARIVKVGYDWDELGYSLNQLVNRSISIVGMFGSTALGFRNIMRLIMAGKYDLGAMITHVLPLAEYERGIQLVKAREAVKVVYHP